MVSLVVVLKLCGLYAQRGQSRIHRARIDMGRLSVASLVRAAERHTLRTTAKLKGQNAKGKKREGLNGMELEAVICEAGERSTRIRAARAMWLLVV